MKNKIHILLIIEITLISIYTIFNIVNAFSINLSLVRNSMLNILIIIAFVFFLNILLMNFIFGKFDGKKWQILLIVLMVGGFNFVMYKGNGLLLAYSGAISSSSSATEYSTTLIAKKDSNYEKLDDLNKSTSVGVQSLNSYENGTLPLEKIQEAKKTQKIKQYSNIKAAFNDLQSGKIDVMSVKNLSDKTLNKLDPNVKKNYKIVTTFKGKEETKQIKKDITKTPFTILVSGVDSRKSNIDDAANSDSNILVTFDPQSGRVTTLTTPRDSYIEIDCGYNSPDQSVGASDKLTHADSYGGTACVQRTLEKLYDVKVDYTIKINFVGVIDIVNALGGIDIDVPINSDPTVVDTSIKNREVCEQGAKGKRDIKGYKCWYEGKINKMDGETALSFARNRKEQDGGDLGRGRNQQIVIEGIIKKATKINNIDTVMGLLNVASKHMKTTLQKDDIVSLYNALIGLDNGVNIEKLYIKGSTPDVTASDGSIMSVVVPFPEDIDYASYRMKVSLKKVLPQFPQNGYGIKAIKPDNSLKKESMPYDEKALKKKQQLENDNTK